MAKRGTKPLPRHKDMSDSDVDLWQKRITNVTELMKPRHEEWRRLLNAYKLEFEVDIENPRKISRFYPLARQIIASVSFNYPQVLMRVEDNNKQYQSEILERTANAMLETIQAKRHINQASFDALFCCLGWLKYGVNPPGDEDLVPPYVANDGMQNGMFYIQRVSPFNVFVDPLCPPHDMSQAQYIIEKMLVPLDLLRKDERFHRTGQITETPEEDPEEMMQDIDGGYEEGEDKGQMDKAKQLSRMVVIYQIHDRIGKRQITFAKGVKQPIQNIRHPFLAGESGVVPDPADPNRTLLTGEFTPTGGYLVEEGFPFHAIKYDLTCDTLYGKPMMAYAEDTQTGVIESVTRRHNWLKRLALIILGNKNEQAENPDAGEQLESAKDTSLLWVSDVNNAFRAMPMENVPPDQLGIESDYRAYEDQILQVGQLVNAGQRTLTATQSALVASFSQLNREWLQQGPVGAYEATVYNGLRIMSDVRYTPRSFLVNVAEGEHDPVYEAVTGDLLQARFKVDIEASSMRPLYEELQREDALALFNYIIQIPEIPRIEAIKHLLRAFRVPNMDKMLGPGINTEAVRAAQLENQWMLLQGKDPGIAPEQDHEIHLKVHMEISKDEGVLKALQQNQGLLVGLQGALQTHIQAHEQALQQKAAGGGGPAPSPGGQINSTRREGGGGSAAGTIAGITQGIQSQVRSNAQTISQAGASIDRGQN